MHRWNRRRAPPHHVKSHKTPWCLRGLASSPFYGYPHMLWILAAAGRFECALHVAPPLSDIYLYIWLHRRWYTSSSTRSMCMANHSSEKIISALRLRSCCCTAANSWYSTPNTSGAIHPLYTSSDLSALLHAPPRPPSIHHRQYIRAFWTLTIMLQEEQRCLQCHLVSFPPILIKHCMHQSSAIPKLSAPITKCSAGATEAKI